VARGTGGRNAQDRHHSAHAWITGLAFMAANLGALEIPGMAANGAQYGR
jgi:hypothetical protein